MCMRTVSRNFHDSGQQKNKLTFPKNKRAFCLDRDEWSQSMHICASAAVAGPYPVGL